MKKSELSFKCYISGKQNELMLRNALCNAGFENDLKCPRDHFYSMPFVIFQDGCISGANDTAFCKSATPLMTVYDAI